LLLISYAEYTKQARFYLPVPVIVTVSIVSHVFIFLLLTPNISILFTAILTISSSVSSIALDIQHILKPFTDTSGELRCHAFMIDID